MVGIISFKLKNHLLWLYRTYKSDGLFIIRHWLLLKYTSKIMQGHFSTSENKIYYAL